MVIMVNLIDRGAKEGGGGGGGLGGSQPHLSTPPDFEKKIFSGGWLPLN